MDRAYAQRYRDLYERHWWWRARERLILDVLNTLVPAGGWRAILDVGCGDGLFFDRLSAFGAVEGVELDATLVSERGRQRRIHVGPFDARFQPGKRYGLILMLDVLEHMPDPTGALRHAVDLLEPEGTMLITLPAFNLLWTNHDRLNRHLTRYTRRSFAMVARAAGVRVCRSRYFFHWVFPAKLAVRLIETTLRLAPAPPRMPPRWTNRLLYLLSRGEQLTLGKLRLPLGSSLLVVAGK